MPDLLARITKSLLSLLDPRAYLHVLHLIHFYGYSYVREKSQLRLGEGTHLPPNVSLRNASRIQIGSKSQISEHCYLWAGDSEGRIIIGDQVSIAPEVFITASDYRFKSGIKIREQPKRERDVIIGDDVWLGARVIVTAGVKIGDGCIVGAGAVVTRDLPPNSIAAGVPAKVIRQRSEND